LSIYVVEDDADVAHSIRFMLSTLKLDCTTFSTGAEFLDCVSGLSPGCVLLDVRLPDTDGVKVQEELVRRGVDWPVIFMTGEAGVSTIVKAIKAGAVEFLIKPFSDKDLLSALQAGQVRLQELRRVSGTRSAAAAARG